MEDAWKTTEFIVLPHKDSKDVYILGGTDDIQQLLDDSNINVATIASSRHVGPIESRVNDWAKQLDLFGKTLVSGLSSPSVPESSNKRFLFYFGTDTQHAQFWGNP